MMERFWWWLLNFAARRLGKRAYVVPDDFGTLVEAATALCEEVEHVEDVSGEWKRHQVYAAMIKTFPQHRKRALSMAIDVALNASTNY